MLSSDWLIKGVFIDQFLVFSDIFPSSGYFSLRIPYSVVFANTKVLDKYYARGKRISLNSL